MNYLTIFRWQKLDTCIIDVMQDLLKFSFWRKTITKFYPFFEVFITYAKMSCRQLSVTSRQRKCQAKEAVSTPLVSSTIRCHYGTLILLIIFITIFRTVFTFCCFAMPRKSKSKVKQLPKKKRSSPTTAKTIAHFTFQVYFNMLYKYYRPSI